MSQVKRAKTDRLTLNFISGVSGVDWRVVAAVMNGGHTRTEQRRRVLAALDVLGYDRPTPNDDSEGAP